MKSDLHKRAVDSRNPMHLYRIINDIWTNLTKRYIESLVASMPKRARIVREQRGGSSTN